MEQQAVYHHNHSLKTSAHRVWRPSNPIPRVLADYQLLAFLFITEPVKQVVYSITDRSWFESVSVPRVRIVMISGGPSNNHRDSLPTLRQHGLQANLFRISDLVSIRQTLTFLDWKPKPLRSWPPPSRCAHLSHGEHVQFYACFLRKLWSRPPRYAFPQWTLNSKLASLDQLSPFTRLQDDQECSEIYVRQRIPPNSQCRANPMCHGILVCTHVHFERTWAVS